MIDKDILRIDIFINNGVFYKFLLKRLKCHQVEKLNQ